MRSKGKFVKVLGVLIFIFVIILSISNRVMNNRALTKEKKVVRIGVCVYKYSDTFVSEIMTDMEQLIKEYEKNYNTKVNLDISDAKESQIVQNEQIQRYISLDYDVICVNIVDRTTAATMIDKAIADNIPLVFFNREPVSEDLFRAENIYYVGSDSKESSILQGELIVNTYKEQPEILDLDGDGIVEYVMLEGEMGHQDSLIRTEWSVQTLKDYGLSVEKIIGGIANFERNQAAALMEQWLKSYEKDIELIICNNDDMALGASDALEKMKISNIKVVGIDGTPAGLEAVKAGKMLGTVLCNAEGHADAIFRIAYSLAVKGTVDETLPIENERYIRVKLKIITQKDLIE